ncbi:flagellar export chaperone FliS [Fuchsiella alkaliacetigena]|uniref:flagellar export chaperone FliS n=1 Tax=Fuchsiella alkaliacetigena TaxID=957042 RepID=UPI00200B3994|nr:flagellar export chaperone FliS [Fuchsiella alkaliacetigena]MCK8824185.1 flagellar export chaperone FliS [Fuchsiella alkaliacetigena]
MTTNPYEQYKNAQYETASQEQLVIMLYKGAVKFANQAKKGLEDEDYTLTNNKLQRAQAIIRHLQTTLDHEQGGEIADNLDSLYDYMNRRLIQANIRKDTEIVDEVIDLLADLQEAWEAAFKKVKGQKMSASGEINVEG